jgi:hypothetical protein
MKLPNDVSHTLSRYKFLFIDKNIVKSLCRSKTRRYYLSFFLLALYFNIHLACCDTYLSLNTFD